MLLLRETFEDVQFLNETTEDGKKNLYIHGPFLEANVVNRNKRYYPLELMTKAVNSYNEEYIKPNRGVGTLGHEDTPTITPDRISHRVISLEQKDNIFMGKALVLNTPCGNIVKNLLEGGVKIGVSSRALGSIVEQNGVNVVQPNLSILCIDAVLDPSAPSAWVDSIMENKQFYYDMATGSYIEKELEQLYEELPKYSKQKIEDTALQLFNWYLNGISTAKI
jgi:hypothetical protein